MRPEIAAACETLLAAQKTCRDGWARMHDRGGPLDPAKVTASQQPAAAAAQALRRLCGADPAAGEAERRQLMLDQVRGDARLGGKTSQEWNSERYRLLQIRDALTIGMGWPYLGEPVTVNTVYHGAGGTQTPITGPGVYVDPGDTHNTRHSVLIPALPRLCPDKPGPARQRQLLSIQWEPCESTWGNADPAGDIGIRLASAPDAKLPVPLPRWPEPADVADLDPLAGYAPGAQLDLFA